MLIKMTAAKTKLKTLNTMLNFKFNSHFPLKKLLVSAIWIVPAFSLNNASAENLMEIYALAYDYDPILKQVVSQRKSVGEGEVQAFAAFLPNVSANAVTQGTNQDKPTGRDDDVTFNSRGYSVDLFQSIFDNTNYVNYRISKLNISRADAILGSAQQDLILRTALAYFSNLSAEDTLEFSQAEKKAIGRQLDQAKRRYEVGIIAITDVHEAQAGFDNASAQVIAAENELLVAREALRELTGTYIDKVTPLAEKIPLDPPSPSDIQHWVDTAQTGNYDVLAAKDNTMIQKENIELQRSGHYPTLGLQASYGYTRSNGPNRDFAPQYHEGTLGVNLNIPIYEGNSVTSKTRQAQYDFQTSQDAYAEVLDSTERTTRSSYLNVISEISRVRALKQAVISNESALKATEAGFEVGTRTIVDVLNVQSELFRAKQEHSDSRYTYILNALRLKLASGELTRDDIERVNSWLAR